MTSENPCGYKILAWVDGKKQEIACDPSKGCLRDLVWSKIGVRGAAAQVLQIPKSSITKAGVDGVCQNPVTSQK